MLLVNLHPNVTGTSLGPGPMTSTRRVAIINPLTPGEGPSRCQDRNGSLLTRIEPITEAESAHGAVRRKPAYMDKQLNIFLQTERLVAAYGRP